MKTRLMTAALASLVVAGFAAAPSFAEETAGQKVDDVTVLTRIKADLLQSKNVDGLDVNVDVKDGRLQHAAEGDRLLRVLGRPAALLLDGLVQVVVQVAPQFRQT